MKNGIENLRWVDIPNPVTGELGERIEVKPITDSWLISPERTWDEVDAILEGRLQDLQEAFQDPKNTIIKFPASYGVERPVSGSMARFLAYVELINQYREVSDGNLKVAGDQRNQFEEKKQKIRDQLGKKGKANKKIYDLYKDHNPTIMFYTEKSNVAEKVKNLILRKATIDLFGAKGNQTEPILGMLPKVIDDSKILLDDSHDEKTKSNDLINYFINTLTSYLNQTRDQNLFNKYRYRTSPDLIAKEKDCIVLDSLLDMALDSESLNTSTETAGQLKKLGRAYFAFLKTRLSKSSNGLLIENYPRLSLIYDIYTTSLYRGKPTIIKGTGDLIDEFYYDTLSSSEFKKEISVLRKRWKEIAAPVIKDLSKDPEISRLRFDDPYPIDWNNTLAEKTLDLFRTPEWRLSTDLNLLAGGTERDALYLFYLLTPNSRTLRKAYNILFNVPSFDSVGEIQVFGFLMNLPKTIIYPKIGLEVSLGSYIAAGYVQEKTAPDQKIESLKILDKLYGQKAPLDFQIEVINRYLPTFFSEVQDNIKQYEKENGFLWNEILNKPEWFISPRGDRYSQEDDPELTDYGLQSITIYPDKRFPREHKILLRIMNINQPLQFWLDTNANITGEEHQLLFITPIMKQPFMNLLLKRVYFITSGLLSIKTLHPTEYTDAFLPLEYRRSHYRYLTSTTNRPITMESHGAQLHAAEIKEDYGIDIYEEIKRRRFIGTLKPNEYLTFVREVTPGIAGQLVLPNEIKYDPTLIQIPV